MNEPAIVLSYAGCDTCRKALAWLASQKIAHTVRAIVDAPPTREELRRWIPLSGVGVEKWLNTSGQSYRAMDRARVAANTEDDWISLLSADGKLVKRPVFVREQTVLVGFKPERWAEALSG